MIASIARDVDDARVREIDDQQARKRVCRRSAGASRCDPLDHPEPARRAQRGATHDAIACGAGSVSGSSSHAEAMQSAAVVAPEDFARRVLRPARARHASVQRLPGARYGANG